MNCAKISTGLLALSLTACAGQKPFPLRDPIWVDPDLESVRAPCHCEPTKDDRHHVACTPRVADSELYSDGMDNLMLRPLTDSLGVMASGEAIDVNSFDEVPDSSWFTNRIARGGMSVDDVVAGACTPDKILDPDSASVGSWVIDKGKGEGATAGFRVVVPGKGKYLLKAESIRDEPERQSAASMIGAAILYAAGYNATCEQVIYLRPSILKLLPGLRSKPNFGDEKAFDSKALDDIIADSPRRGDHIRMGASEWISGHIIGPFSYDGTRSDDPNDVVPHEDRRELRGMRVLSSWIDRYDTRRGNTLDTWIADAKDRPDSSPGHVVHYQLDTSETIGGAWPWDPLTRRMSDQYVLDWGDMGLDFITLGVPTRSWDTKTQVVGEELFGYFDVSRFHPDHWYNAYPNAAYSRATARDEAWMARILAHFTPEMIDSLAKAGNFTDPRHATYLAQVLRGRLDRILVHYLTGLSPVTDVRVEGDRLCGVDLAEWRGVRPPSAFHYTAHVVRGAPLATRHEPNGRVCVGLTHGNGSYVRIAITDGVAKGRLVAHLYDLGPRGFRLVGLERPSPKTADK